ncbi:MAG: hypothetical protein JST68_08190 [Bacteroidetes bacterium]|nr:hypothetical protein [Bacteroidota bacterium]
MEEQQITPVQDLDNFFNITFDNATRSLLRQAAVWAKISTLCAFVGYGISLIVAVVGRPTYPLGTEGAGITTMVTSARIFSTLITVAIGVFINYFLYRFAVSAIKGIDSLDTVSTNEGFNNLRKYFKILGICLIIGLCFVALALVLVLVNLGARSRY